MNRRPESLKTAKWIDTKKKYYPRRKLALLLPGHNEELILAITIKSALASGQKLRDIYVVNDASTDNTRKIAESLLGKQNVLNVHRSGKALAVQKAIKKFEIERQYQWIHIADADSIFSSNYFREYRRRLDNEYAVAIGFVQSLRGNWISTYRSFVYTYGQQVYRRIQTKLGMVPVFPGPVTSFRTDILSQLDISGDSLTEDFDITLQVHRKRLGKTLFIPQAVNYTQDPQNLKDFYKQSMRWYRGFFQGVVKYKIGRGGQRIDLGISFQLGQTLLFIVQLVVLLPLVIVITGNWSILLTALAIDIIFTDMIVVLTAIHLKRWSVLGVLPYFYFFRSLEIIMFVTACIEIVILKRFKTNVQVWSTEGRRYKIRPEAFRDTSPLRTS